MLFLQPDIAEYRSYYYLKHKCMATNEGVMIKEPISRRRRQETNAGDKTAGLAG